MFWASVVIAFTAGLWFEPLIQKWKNRPKPAFDALAMATACQKHAEVMRKSKALPAQFTPFQLSEAVDLIERAAFAFRITIPLQKLFPWVEADYERAANLLDELAVALAAARPEEVSLALAPLTDEPPNFSIVLG